MRNEMTDDSGITRIFISDGSPKAKALEMYTNAGLFISDADRLLMLPSAGPYVLLAHAIELLLKAYLHSTGIPLDDLRKRFSHKLDELQAETERVGLVISDPDANDLTTRLAVSLEKAALRYDFNFQNLPMHGRLIAFARSLQSDVKPHVQ
jgi:hypothetical protein